LIQKFISTKNGNANLLVGVSMPTS